MANKNVGCQTIGCRVASCRYHSPENVCELMDIWVEPKQGGGTGEPSDESMCGSYKAK